MHFKYLPGIVAIAAIVAALFAFTGWKSGDKDYEEQKMNTVIRKIGHHILLMSGDSSSRVLPVKELEAGHYQLRFESPFSFVPDSLIKTVQAIIDANKLPKDYLVNVVECTGKQVVYSFAISQSKQDDVLSCMGRNQPLNCYYINLFFKTKNEATQPKNILIYAGFLLAAAILIAVARSFYKKNNSNLEVESTRAPVQHPPINIGQFIFREREQLLLINDEKIDLTSKEAALLSIFAKSPNEIIDRTRLQKEVWEDEGVIVGRSLDVFISKLRKKLEKDPAISIVNIHGKGYKLSISELDA